MNQGVKMISNEEKNSIIKEICSFIGTTKAPPFLVNNNWIVLASGIWVITKEQQVFIEKQMPETLQKKIKYAGIFLGKIRKNFGLSMEALYPLQPFISRYAIIKGKTLQKYLYGKSVIIEIVKADIQNLELNKLIIMTSERQAVGISSFTVLEEVEIEEKAVLKLKLEPITDLGMFLRNERTMFE